VEELCVNIGAEVIIERCNDVIPGIKEVVRKNNGAFQPPDKCPVCGAITVTDGKFVYCSNEKTCPPQVKGRINKWINEHGILEWGDAVITKLIESGKVKDIGDLYRLTAADIASLDRMGDKSAANLIEELDKYRSVTLESFLGGLCIRGIATSIAKAVVDAGYDSLDDIISVSVHELEQIPGFGYDRATAFYNGIIKNTDRINDILNAGLTIKARIKGSLTGKSVCFTGTMEQPRALLQKMVEENGGEVKKSVGKGTTYLVISDPNSNSSKAQAARKLGTILISEKQFLDMIKSGT
jgi:DNA ligase (NAD+)